MCCTLIPFLVLVFVKTAALGETFDNDSTTQPPSDMQQLDARLTQQTEHLEVNSKAKDNRIEVLEKQLNEAIRQNHRELQDPLISIQNRLTVSENQIAEIQSTLKTFRNPPRDCKEVQERGNNRSGLYQIQPVYATGSFPVLCDMKTRNGGWTYFLNRFDGSQDFYLNWTDYKYGFGNLGKEFWLGLEHLYKLTGYQENELLIELVDWDHKEAYAYYSTFSIGSEAEGYHLKLLGGYSGDAGDDLGDFVGCKFTTKDRDQDYSSQNCATFYTGAWWYANCMGAHLTGKYEKGNVSEEMNGKVMLWSEFRGSKYSLKQARMMVKPPNRDNRLSHEKAN